MYILNSYTERMLVGGGGSNSIFVCEHFAKKRGWTDINVHKSAHIILRSWHELLLLHDLSASTDQERGYPGIQKHSQS